MLRSRFASARGCSGSAPSLQAFSRSTPVAACHPTSSSPTSAAPSAAHSASHNYSSTAQQPLHHRQQALSWRRALLGPRRGIVALGQASSTLHLPMDRDLEEPLPGFDSIADALADLAAGKFLVVLDDESRENEGDLIIAADKVTTEAMAFMVEYTSGVVCIGMEGRDLDRLRLPLMVSSAENEEAMYTAFTVTVDLRDGITTGISAADRANTIRTLADPSARPEQFRKPGHIFPLRARSGGVLVRPGHTEASVDLARLAGCFPAGALCEIVSKADGSMARTPELLAFSRQQGLRCIAIADLMRYRLRHERLVSRTASVSLSSRHGPIQVNTYTSALDGAEHVAIVVGGDVAGKSDVAVYVHAQSSVADLLGCAPATASASAADEVLRRMSLQGGGVLVYMQQPGNASASVADEVQRLSTGSSQQSPAALDLVAYGLATQIIADLQVRSVCVASNDQTQVQALKSCGVHVMGTWGGDAHVANGHVAASNGRAHAAQLKL